MGNGPSSLWGWNVKDIAALCHVDLATARRWKRGAICPPYAALCLLNRDLGVFDPKWAGWSVARGNLYSPEGWELPLGEVRALPLLRSQLSAYQDVNRGLKAALDEARTPQMEDQPLPDQWQVSYGS